MAGRTRIILVTALILLVPLGAMLFTDAVRWDWFDFLVAGTLLTGTGLLYQWAARKLPAPRQRVAIGLVLGLVLLIVWAELAVGIFGTPFSGS